MDGGRAVVVTGASSGIGRATAEVLAGRGVLVFAGVRRQEDARSLSEALGERVVPVMLDVTDPGSIAGAAEEVDRRLGGRTLFGLVNNAGVAIPGPLSYQPMEEIRLQFEVNLFGALAVSRAFLPLLGADRSRIGAPGRIVNVSSVGGKIAAPFVGAYAAAKHALEGMGESLRRELMAFGIDVIVVAPGAVVTPIWEKADRADLSRYDRTPLAGPLRAFREFALWESRRGYPPERIGEAILSALTARRPRARYAVVPGRPWNWTLPMLLPTRLVDRIIAAQLGLSPRTSGAPGR
ncbi:SDR family oxidoreductase [Tautonia sociabilis]|uniref:SDR family oxidoreductase n=1 Tax=Tautonia sociabilis TaxID=2080755 RepID=A0A432MJH8_9BACT|nr:SDR family oxidoreductase [Tautonia sociabilis]